MHPPLHTHTNTHASAPHVRRRVLNELGEVAYLRRGRQGADELLQSQRLLLPDLRGGGGSEGARAAAHKGVVTLVHTHHELPKRRERPALDGPGPAAVAGGGA